MVIIRNFLSKALAVASKFQVSKTINPLPGILTTRKRGMAGQSNPARCKVALITGGAIGIGREFAETLLKCGARGVVIGDVREAEGEQAASKFQKEFGEKKVHFMKCDVTKKDDIENLFKCAKDRYKKVDILINNAGLLQDKNWSLEVDVNVKGVVQGTLTGFEHMGQHRDGVGGVIINVASIYGLQQAFACPVYNGTKSFLIYFSHAMSHEYYESLTGVKVFTICPGVTDTNMIDESAKYGLEGFGDVGKLLSEELGNLPSQPASACGQCLIKLLSDGVNGSIWVTEDSECYKICLADRHTLRA